MKFSFWLFDEWYLSYAAWKNKHIYFIETNTNVYFYHPSGAFVDMTQNYDISFYVFGGIFAFSGVMCIPLRYIKRWEDNKKSKQQMANGVEMKAWGGNKPHHFRNNTGVAETVVGIDTLLMLDNSDGFTTYF